MILPGKHLKHDRALIGVGAQILAELDQPRSVSELWERVRSLRGRTLVPLSFDWFVLALSFLFAIKAIGLADGIVFVRGPE